MICPTGENRPRARARVASILAAVVVGLPAGFQRGAAAAPDHAPDHAPDLGSVRAPAVRAVGGAVAPVGPVIPDDPLTVQVLTFAPGSHPFSRFGHDAIRLIDRRVGTDTVYNFGTFSFDSPRLIFTFLKGRLRYWLSRSSMAATVRAYQRENRDIVAQELDLSPEQKMDLVTRLEVNLRPENRYYQYDYFTDNCSTRVRDVLDAVLRGRVRSSAVGLGSMSLRSHALRMAADDLPLYTALLIVLGPRTDRPTDEWAETFLPEMLQRTLRGVQAGSDAAMIGPLVKTERVLFHGDRPPSRREPPNRLPAFLGVGLALGLLMFLLGRAGARVWPARALFGLLLAIAGLVLGGVGCFLAGAWALTPHAVVYRNENVLLFAPFAIALTVTGLGTMFGRPRALRHGFLFAAAALGLAVTAAALKLFPWARQENGALILLTLPLWTGITAGTRAVGGRNSAAQDR